MTNAPAAKSGARGEIHDWYCQGLTGCSAKIRSTEDAGIWRASPALVISAGGSGPVQRDSGTPVAAGSWQASATTAARVSSPIRRGRPGRGQVSQPVQAAPGEPAPPLAHGVHGDPQVCGDPHIVPVACGSQHDLRPQPVPVRCLRPPDAFLQGGALAGAQHDRHSAKQRYGSSGSDYGDAIRSRAPDPNRPGHPRAA
jgi:hypothetical protein